MPPTSSSNADLFRALSILVKSHPWHGVAIGAEAPAVVTTFVELVPSDTVKYELDKVTGLLKIDRPQQYSNVCPTPYGFIPQTLCAEKVGELCSERTGRPGIVGDGDPMDICVLTEKDITHGNILVQAIPIGGLRMLDGSEADDKIVAVLLDDVAFGSWRDISDCPAPLLDRLRHYFLTYKQSPDRIAAPCEITHVYGREEAFEVIRRSHEDYRDHFGSLTGLLASSPSMTRAATSAPKRATAAASGARPRGRRPRRSSGRGTSR
ncbi:MAG TPA: inorganic pyrophosphatase [Vicinamibacteria bacterium]|nr:inorganic pyrophosphatase [Vicinamibacteria bacterium]